MMKGFAFWVVAVVAAVWLMTSDLLVIGMLGVTCALIAGGGLIGYVHGYCERDQEARGEVLLRENSIGRN